MAALQAALLGVPPAAQRSGRAAATRAAPLAPGALGLGRRGAAASSSGSTQRRQLAARAAAEQKLDFAMVPWDASRETW